MFGHFVPTLMLPFFSETSTVFSVSFYRQFLTTVIGSILIPTQYINVPGACFIPCISTVPYAVQNRLNLGHDRQTEKKIHCDIPQRDKVKKGVHSLANEIYR